MLKISVSPEESVSQNFNEILGKEKIKYRKTVEVVGFVGKPFSAYFGVVLLNERNEEISRLIRWLNDFSGKNCKKSLVFSIPKDCKKFVSILRINTESPVRAQTQLEIKGLDKTFEEVANKSSDNFELLRDYQIPFLRELTIEEENQLEENLVWIIGPPRSGTSWFGTQLLAYQTLSMNEPQIGLHLGIRQPRIKEQMVRHIDLFQNEPDYFFSQQYSATWKYYLRKLIINRIFSQFDDLKNRIIIKEPNGSIGIDIITQCLPKSKIIFLIRDGRDAIDSKLDSMKENSWAIKTYGYSPLDPKRRIQELRFQSKLWVKLMDILEYAYDKHSNERKIMIKYEILRNNTFEELKKVYRFIDIEIPDKKLKEIIHEESFENMPKEIKGEGKVIRTANPGKWKSNFTKEEKTIMEEIMGEKLRSFGYQDE